jgi:hypothetical protein
VSAQNGKYQKKKSNVGAHLFITFIMKNTSMDYDDLQNQTSANIFHWRGHVLCCRAQQVVWFHVLSAEVKVYVAVNWRLHSQSVSQSWYRATRLKPMYWQSSGSLRITCRLLAHWYLGEWYWLFSKTDWFYLGTHTFTPAVVSINTVAYNAAMNNHVTCSKKSP